MRLDGLQEKLKNYRDGNKMILEEQEDGCLDTSKRGVTDQGSLSSLRLRGKSANDEEKTILFEKLSRVSSYSKL